MAGAIDRRAHAGNRETKNERNGGDVEKRDDKRLVRSTSDILIARLSSGV